MDLSYQIIYHPLAEEEYREHIRWYEDQRFGLGYELIQEVERTLDYIQDNPLLFSVRKKNFREAAIKIFPFIIVYKILPKKKLVVIISIFQTSQHPAKKYRR